MKDYPDRMTAEQARVFGEDVLNIVSQIPCGRVTTYSRERGKEEMRKLRLLALTPFQREVIVKTLQAEDYVEGPVIDLLNKEGEMWVFGKDVKGREVYIKITLGNENGQTICISFHIAEHPLVYPFK